MNKRPMFITNQASLDTEKAVLNVLLEMELLKPGNSTHFVRMPDERYEAIASGRQSFAITRNTDDFSAGDVVVIEHQPLDGRFCIAKVSAAYSNPKSMRRDRLCVVSFEGGKPVFPVVHE